MKKVEKGMKKIKKMIQMKRSLLLTLIPRVHLIGFQIMRVLLDGGKYFVEGHAMNALRFMSDYAMNQAQHLRTIK